MSPQKISRRRALTTGGALAAGGIVATQATGASAAAPSPGGSNTIRTAGFGWELENIHNNGADIYFPVQDKLILRFLEFDTAYMLTAPPPAPGFIEILYTGGIHHGKPEFGDPPQVYEEFPHDDSFGTGVTDNPNNLVGPFNDHLGAGQFLSLILKSWCPADGTASSSERHIHTDLYTPVGPGDSLAFHMDHAGLQVDAEVQVIVGYSVA